MESNGPDIRRLGNYRLTSIFTTTIDVLSKFTEKIDRSTARYARNVLTIIIIASRIKYKNRIFCFWDSLYWTPRKLEEATTKHQFLLRKLVSAQR